MAAIKAPRSRRVDVYENRHNKNSTGLAKFFQLSWKKKTVQEVVDDDHGKYYYLTDAQRYQLGTQTNRSAKASSMKYTSTAVSTVVNPASKGSYTLQKSVPNSFNPYSRNSSTVSPITDMSDNSSTTKASTSSSTGVEETEVSSRKQIVVTSKAKVLCCDKCDGKHETDDCPYYKKNREKHPDAQKSGKHIGGSSLLPGAFISNARVVRQPGDGSCLFHSMSYGLRNGQSASKLRSEVCSFIQQNPNMKISDTPLKDWIKWDSGRSCSEYARFDDNYYVFVFEADVLRS